MAQLKRNSLENRAESFVERRYNQRERQTRTQRFAGELFGKTLAENLTANRDKIKPQEAQPEIKLGFAENDGFGPDESWASADPIKYKPFPEYYNKYQKY